MARNWRDVRKQAVETGQIDPQRVGQHFEQYRAGQLPYRLSELSRTELGTVEAYVRALGGRVKVIAEFPDGELVTLD